MPKWEYCRLEAFSKPYRVLYMRVDGAQSFEVKRDKNKGDGSDDAAYLRTIAELGLQGWEALGYQGPTGNILFKRQLP
ncbi:MAG TPA: hypothetical protein VFU60_01300 [Ktedonobacterales bacterium]|nr:hypothetical protein [Ktedonobacterales bacterium]